MNSDEIKKALMSLPMTPSTQEELKDPESLDEIVSEYTSLSREEFALKLIELRLWSLQAIISEVGFLPSQYIWVALAGSAESLRTLDRFNDDFSHMKVTLDIKAIGEGIAKAGELETTDKDETAIRATSTHSFLESLDVKASAGDCFLFNAMVAATKNHPFKDIEISPVLEHFYSRVSQMEGMNTGVSSTLSVALDMTARDIFGQSSALLSEVSAPRTKEPRNPLFTIALVAAGLFVGYLLAG